MEVGQQSIAGGSIGDPRGRCFVLRRCDVVYVDKERCLSGGRADSRCTKGFQTARYKLFFSVMGKLSLYQSRLF